MSSRNYALKGEQREKAGKGVARSLRREYKIPGVIYGDGKAPVLISLPAKEVNLEYRKGHMYTSLCDLDIGGQKHMVLARDVQLHPVTDNAEHIDFMRVTPKTKLHVHVPVKFVNESACPGITADKGVLNIVMHDLELICLATDIPDHLEADLTGLTIGNSIKISNIKMPAGAASATKRDLVVATILEQRKYVEEVVVAPVAAEGAEGAAPAEGAEGAAPAEGAAAPAAGDKKAEGAAPAKGGDAKGKK